MGAKPGRIIWRHILPNSLGPIVIWLTLQIPGLIMAESTLSFIGLGVRPPTPTWGAMLSEGWRAMRMSFASSRRARVRSSMSGGQPESSPAQSVGPWTTETAGARGRDAMRLPSGATPTMSSTGLTAVPRTSTT